MANSSVPQQRYNVSPTANYIMPFIGCTISCNAVNLCVLVCCTFMHSVCVYSMCVCLI